MISYEGAGARYVEGGPWSVRELNFELNAGETLALLGPSGSGKSTTMKLANGLLPLSEGDVRIEGESVRTWDLVKLRRRLGYVVQRGGLFPHLKTGANVGLLAELEGWERKRINTRVEELFELVELDGALEERYPFQLSGGQAQRVSLARALMLDPPVLLMDEPFSALDPLTKAELLRWLAKLSRELGKAVLWVTHDIRGAFSHADRVALMDGGRIVQLDTPDAVRAAPSSDWIRSFLEASA